MPPPAAALRSRRCLVASALLLLAAGGARGDILDVANGLRRAGCDAHPGGVAPARAVAPLADVARRLARGAELGAALAAAGYRADDAFAAHVRDARGDAEIAAVLRARFCARLLDARLTEAGQSHAGAESWLVLAAPAPVSALADPDRIGRRVLKLINAARARPRRCGTEDFAAARPLTWSFVLAGAARVHARDMEQHGFFDHTGSDGSDPWTRVARTGYQPRSAGENLALNQESPEEVVAGWLASPHHCANIMDAHFRELGLAYVVSRQREQSIYWDLTLGAR